jgi:hypothetical protein
MFDIGGNAALLNTDLLEESSKAGIRFRIIGRHALKDQTKEKAPSMSWSVPLGWFWTMSGRIQKDKMEPNPLDVSSPLIMKNFREG